MLHLSSPTRVALLTAAALLTCGAASAEARSSDRAQAVPVMGFGAAALPPVGFLDLCERSRDVCAPAGTPVPDIAALRTAALQRFWADAFAQRRTAPAASGETRFDWSRAFAASQARPATAAAARAPRPATPPVAAAPSGFGRVWAMAADEVGSAAVETDADAMMADTANAAGDMMAMPRREIPRREAAQTMRSAAATTVHVAQVEAGAAKVFELDRAGWRIVNAVNRRVNRSIRQVSDDRLYGVEDFWAVPDGGRGDCEDFVLAKRQALISEGVPAEALSIAIVETRWGETHAVLLLASDRGEYVLDNLSPWVSRWDRVNYTWRERQLPGKPFDWVTAAI